MRLLIAAIADQANVSDGGKLNVFGVFDRIMSQSFPARHPILALALRLAFEYEDTREEPHVLDVQLVDQDGRKLVGMRQHLKVGALKPGDNPIQNDVVHFQDLTFQRPDEYAFVITWDGKEVQRLPLGVQLIPPPTPPAVNK